MNILHGLRHFNYLLKLNSISLSYNMSCSTDIMSTETKLTLYYGFCNLFLTYGITLCGETTLIKIFYKYNKFV